MAGCNKFQHHRLASNENIMNSISSSSSSPEDVQQGGGGGGCGGRLITESKTTTTRKKKLSNSNKRNKLLDLKVVYISTPMKVKTSASKFREIVQLLTGKYSDVARIMEKTTGKNDTCYWTTEHEQDQDQDHHQNHYRRRRDSSSPTSSSCSLSAGGTTCTTAGSTTSSLLILNNNNNNMTDENLLVSRSFVNHPRFMMDVPDHLQQYHSSMADDVDGDDEVLLQGPFNLLEFLCDQTDPDPEQDHLVDVLPSF